MGLICIFIVFLIFVLLVLRNKKINPNIIDFLCTFSVLVLFEFINLLIHAKVEDLTEHNLLLTLFFLLIVASIIIPLHHKMEHWLKKRISHNEKEGHN